MKKWLIVSLVVFGIGFILWNQRNREAPASPGALQADDTPKVPEALAVDEPAATPKVRTQTQKSAEPEPAEVPQPEKLDPRSDEFFARVETVIPRRLYSEAAVRCRPTGLHPDQKIKLAIKVRVVGGEVFVQDATILHSNISDPTIEACLRDAVRNARWRDEQMPDWEDDDELLIRIKGLKKHLDLDDQDDSDQDENP